MIPPIPAGDERRGMFGSIVVGTDGSETANEAVRQATELAKSVGASIDLVSAYEPVSSARLREEAQQVPKDLEWMVNPREDVDATLKNAAEDIAEAGVKVQTLPARAIPPTRSSTWPRSA